jgi:3-oxoacyl-[acyl-carrier protein] reductase
MNNLEGKVALVSGSGRGIGRAIALKLARHGAKVVVNDLDAGPGDAVAAEIKAAGGDAVAVNGDVAAAGFADRFVAAAVDRLGGLDIIVNNAGYTWDSTIQKMSDEQFKAMLDVHLVAPFRILRAAAEPIRVFAKREAAEGREVFRKVVNISSVAGLYGNAGQLSYSAAKASLIGVTRTLCKEWGRYKVNVNCVAFGLIHTRLTQAIEEKQATIDVAGREIKVGVQPHLLETMDRLIPLGRGGTPEEAANAVYLFCTPESNYISGQLIVAGGGLLM